jgi:hypothetical protein
MQIEDKYNHLCSTTSDINEHLPVLKKYAEECQSIIELGVRGVISTYALIYGLLNNGKKTKKILLNDIAPCDINELLSITNDLPIEVNFQWVNDLQLEIKKNVDLTFIDTWHVYGQLKRELSKFSKFTNKYIILHDTTVDEWQGETIRNGWNAKQQSKETGMAIDEINKGLWPAIEEFLLENKDWQIKSYSQKQSTYSH